MATSKMKLRVRRKPATSSISQAMSAEASPDSKCPICLDKFKNMAYLDLCLHKFCFRCIHEWSKNKAECPLCKQPFNSIFHSIKAENDFKKYDLRPTENGSFGNLSGQRFRYRTTVTNNRRRPTRRTSPPPDNGVMFESLAAPASPRHDRSLHRMMLRLAARQRAESEGRAMRAMREQEMIKFRRALYRRGVRVRSVRDNGRTRDTSAEFFQRNPACLHRLVPWLRRELMVLYGAHGSLVNIVQHIIMSQITRYNMEDNAIVQELRPFLQARTEHFVHEFINFARSPYNMEAYDQHAVYDCPAPSSEEDSSSNSSVIAISEDEEDSVGLGSNPNSMSASILSQTPWDDETPGPSYSTEAAQPAALPVSVSDSESSVEEARTPAAATQGTPPPEDTTAGGSKDKEHASSGEDDCLIVGYVKPMAERTPELVHLSSDSEHSEKEESASFPKAPQHIRFGSGPNSPASIASSSSKHNSAQQPSSRETVEKGEERSASEKVRESSTQEGPPSSGRCTPLRLVLSKHKRSDAHEERGSRDREQTRSRSGSSSWSRSRSHDRSSHSSKRRSRSQSRERHRDASHLERRHGWHAGDLTTWDKNRERDRDREAAALPHAYHWHSYSHYSCERDRNRKHYTEKRSSYTSCYVSPERRSRPRSRSRAHTRSRSRSQEPRRREKKRSRSRSSSESRSSRRKSKHDKPGGKRKYKTRHLEDATDKDEASQQQQGSLEEGEVVEKTSQEKHKKKSRERATRSPSVEIVYEGMSSDQAKRHHKKKKKHKKKSKRHKERAGKDKSSRHSPVVITIDSDSDRDLPTKAKDFTFPIGSNSDTDDAIPSLTPPFVPTGNPADSCTLDSIFHQWEQQFSTIGQNLGATALASVPDPLTGEPVLTVSKPRPIADAPDTSISSADVLIGQPVQLNDKTTADPLTDVEKTQTPPPLVSQADALINQQIPPVDMPHDSKEYLDPLAHLPRPLAPSPHPPGEEPAQDQHEPTVGKAVSTPTPPSLGDEALPSSDIDLKDKKDALGGSCDLPLEDS